MLNNSILFYSSFCFPYQHFNFVYNAHFIITHFSKLLREFDSFKILQLHSASPIISEICLPKVNQELQESEITQDQTPQDLVFFEINHNNFEARKVERPRRSKSPANEGKFVIDISNDEEIKEIMTEDKNRDLQIIDRFTK